ncbi:MAG: BNR-4 repeat-containing protein [Bacteroidia bacterium]|nr:BNR-4 repeat-containing protein [Bacteroidia bacterium]
MTGPLKNSEYKYKYSGGLGTYPSNHYPFSVYVSEVNKTFFCYGGTNKSNITLLHEVSYFDHATGEVARPTIVLDKATTDAHDNPVIQVDKNGYIWLFSTAHATKRPSFIHRSVKPYDIKEFERIPATKMMEGKEVPMDNFSYLQMYYSNEHGFTGLFTHYEKVGGRVIAWMTSKDGVHWSEWKDLSHLGVGHYQTSSNKGDLIGTSFNYHPNRKIRGGLDYRTNLYYLQSKDFGKTWQAVDGKPIELPLKEVANKALIHDYDSEERNVYINDINFDKNGYPVILYITSKGPSPGAEDGPREWHTAHWTGKKWEIRPITISDHNYDMGSVYIEDDGTWRIIGPTETGPQQYNTGGEIAMWISKDEGQSWKKVKQLTSRSEYNHSYPRRPVNANPDFYAFWSDGHGRQLSKSHLYFSDQEGNVFILPEKMTGDFAKPVLYKPGLP